MINVHVGLTYKCNLNCRHCYVKQKENEKNLLFDEKVLINTIDILGASIITYTYSENMLYNDFYEFVNHMKQKGYYQILISNGILINSKKIVEELEVAGINQINISIDSSKEKKHDYNRNYNGAFSSAIKALNLLKNNGNIKMLISTCVTHHNYYELLDIVKLGESVGVNTFSFLRERTRTGFKPIHKDYYKNMCDVIVYCEKNNIELNLHDFNLNNWIKGLFNNGEISVESYQKLIDMNSCHMLRDFLLISPNGDLYPCVFSGTPICNIYKDNIKESLLKIKTKCLCDK